MDSIFLTRADLKKRGITISNTTLLRREASVRLNRCSRIFPKIMKKVDGQTP
jgi:hypothetical protein